jgi:hypothetical protein
VRAPLRLLPPARRLLGALVTAVVLGTGPATAQAPARGAASEPLHAIWPDTTYVDAVVRLTIEGGPDAVIGALTYNATLMLPLRQLAEMAELHLADFVLRDSAVLVLEPGQVRIRFKPGAPAPLTSDAIPVPHDTIDIAWWDGDLFVATRILDQLLGTRTSVDWASLSAVIGETRGLPIVQHARRERRRQLIGVQRPTPNVLDLAVYQRPVDGAVASWSFLATATGPSEQLSLDLGLGAGVLGGSAELRPLLYASDGVSHSELRMRWWKAWPDGSPVRQLHIGDVVSSGRRSRFVQGIAVTNAPYIRSSEFDVEQFVTQVPAGWEAELYRGSQLLGYADADAVGAFRVPLQLGYGANPLDLVLYGPGGQTVRQSRTIRVPFSRIATGQLEYAAAAGRCRYDDCQGMVSADARYGLTNRVTVQGGWDAFFRDAERTLWQPYALVSGSPLPTLGLTGEAVVNGLVRASANYEPSLDLRVTAGLTRYSETGAAFDGNPFERTRSEASLFWRPGWMRGQLYLQGAGVLSSGAGASRRMERLSATTRVGQVRYALGLLHDRYAQATGPATSRFAFDGGADAVLMGPYRWLRATAVQGQVAIEPARGLTALRAMLGRRVGRLLRLDGGIGWQRASGVSLELAFTTANPGPRVGARSRVTSEAGSSAMVFASGAAAVDPRTHLVRFSDEAALGRAGVSGVLFRDDNNNGRQDAGEPGLADVPVRIGGWPATTDSTGRFAAWGMFATEPLRIDVDTLSFGNPALVMPAPVLRVRPGPNAFGLVSVPVVVGAEVGGYVVVGEEPVPEVPVVLRELNTGKEITTITFRDGGFYRAGVPPGEYEITLPDDVLQRLRLIAPPLSIFVPPGAGEKRFDDLQLRLERAQ